MDTNHSRFSLVSRILTAFAAQALALRSATLAILGAGLVLAGPGLVAQQTASTTTLTASANSATYGQAVTLKAVVAGNTTPNGTVTFMENGQALPNQPSNGVTGAGTYVYTSSTLPVGTHYYSAQFGNDSQLAPSSGALNPPLEVNVANTTTALAGGGTIVTSVYGQQVTFTATVTAKVAGPPFNGNVVFMDGSNILAQVPVGSGGTATLAIPGAYVTTPLNIATHTITAVYSGDASPATFGVSPASTAISQKVIQASTTTSLGASASSPVYGQSVAFTATVTSASGQPMPDGGVVSFYDNGGLLGTGILASGLATYSNATLAVSSSHSITATYGGDIYNTSSKSSGSLLLTVSQASSSVAVTLASGPSPSYYGQSVTFSATVAPVVMVPPSIAVPTGTVTFYDGTTALGSPATLSNGVATLTISTLTPQTNSNGIATGSQIHSISATYNPPTGSTNFAASSSTTLTQTVGPAPENLVLTASSNTPVYGQALTLTASGLPSTITNSTATTETITFTDSFTSPGGNTTSSTLGSANVSGGRATLTIATGVNALLAGTHSLTATYGGDAYHDSLLTPQALVLAVAPATPTFQSLTATSGLTLNQAAMFNATLTGAGVSPTGMVNFSYGSTTLIGTLASGTTSPTTTQPLTLGSNTITATYGGDSNYVSITKTLTVSVGQDGTTITLASSAPASLTSGNPTSTYSQPVTITAYVTLTNPPGSTTLAPTGTVTFTDSYTNTSGTVTSSTLASGVTGSQSGNTAKYTFAGTSSNLKAGSHSISASYNGDTNSAKSSTPDPLIQVVSQDTTSLAQVNANVGSPAMVETSFTFDKSVSLVTSLTSSPATTGLATGTVTFTDSYTSPGSTSPNPPTPLGTANLTSAGTATLNLNNMLLGTHSVMASYSGDNNFAATSAPSTAVGLSVSAPTTTSVVSSQNPSNTLGTVTFTAAVGVPNGYTGTPTGTVVFSDGGNALNSSGATVNGGQASLPVPNLTAGAHSITAAFSSTTQGLASSSSQQKLSQVVDQVTTLSLGYGSTTTPPFLYGQPATIIATVADNPAGGASTPTGGYVTFLDGTTSLSSIPIPLVNGTATLTTSTLVPTTTTLHSITASYGGSGLFLASTTPVGSALTPTVNQNTPAVALTSNATGPLSYNAPVTFTANVPVPAGTSGAVPTGSVTFTASNTNPITNAVTTTTLGSANLSAGVATFTSSALAGGADSVTATYTGNANYTASLPSNPVSVAVTSNLPTLTLASNHVPSVTGQSVTFTATLAPVAPITKTPTGTVTFSVDGGTATTVNVSGGKASYSVALSPVGSPHTLSANYSGDPDFSSITSTLPQTVTTGTSAIALAPSASASSYSQPVTFSATVTAVSPATGTPTGGPVTFYAGGNQIGLPQTLNNGKATIITSALPQGSNAITASYGGDLNFAGSPLSAEIFQNVVMSNSSVALASSAASPVSYNLPLSFTATVTAASPATGTPTGSVTFTDGATFLATVPLPSQPSTPPAPALATYTPPSFLLPGSHPITAAFSGDQNFNSFTTKPLSMTVNADATTTVLTASGPSTSGLGQNVSFTAAVTTTTAGGAVPTGSVKFMDSGNMVDTETLVANGPTSAGATFATNSLKLGSHIITAVYVPTNGTQTSTSPAVTQVVANLTITSTTLAAQPASPLPGQTASPVYGQPVTLTATVTPAPTALTGNETVIFYDNSVALYTGKLSLSGGVATASYTPGNPGNPPLAIGAHILTATYGGDATLAGSNSAALTPALTVTPGLTTTTVTASPASSSLGQSVTFAATVTPSYPDAPAAYGTVTFTDTTPGTPSTYLGTGTLTPGTGSPTVTFTTSAPLAGGSRTITAAYAGDIHWAASQGTAAEMVNSAAPGVFTASTDVLSTARSGQTITLLPGGLVLVAGGDIGLAAGMHGTAEIHDPTGQTPTATFTLSTQRSGHTATLLADGTVLLAGGDIGLGAGMLGTSEILNPAIPGATTAGPELLVPRTGHTASPLQNGTVLLAGGSGAAITAANGAEILNPFPVSGVVQTDTAVTMSIVRSGHTATPLPDGTVLVAGGDPAGTGGTTGTAEIYNPATGSFNGTINLSGRRSGAAAILLPATPATGQLPAITGSVLLLGGTDGSATPLLKVDSYAFSSGAFAYTGQQLNNAWPQATANRLPDGNILVAGTPANGTTPYPEILNPASTTPPTSTTLASGLSGAAGYATGYSATLLETGLVFFAGGTTLGTQIFLFNPQDPTLLLPTVPNVALSVPATQTTSSWTDSLTDPNPLAGAESYAWKSVNATATVNTTAPLGSSINVSYPPSNASSVTVDVLSTSALGIPAHGSGVTQLTSGTGNETTVMSLYVNLGSYQGTPEPLTSIQTTYGTALNFTVTVFDQLSNLTPYGTVTLQEGSNVLATGVLAPLSNISSTIIFPISNLGPQTQPHSITATYAGSNGLLGSTSPNPVSVTVIPNSDRINLSSSALTSTYDQPVTFTATVAAQVPGTPTGTVTFFNGGTPLGQAAALVAGQASLTTSTLPVGGNSITASYSGDTYFNPSTTATALSEVINPSSTATSLTSNANPAYYGQTGFPVLTATVATTPASNLTPSGTVTFYVGSTPLGSQQLINGTVSIAPTLAMGGSTITAVYTANSNSVFAGSTSAGLSQVMDPMTTSTALSASPSAPVAGQLVTLTAAVTATSPGNAIPTGTVTFMDGTTVLGTAQNLNNGIASWTQVLATGSTQNMTATYSGLTVSGVTDIVGSSGSLSETVAMGTAMVTLNQPTSPKYGQPVTFTATVAPISPATGTPSGSVTFFNGSTPLGLPATLVAGQASLTTSTLPVGNNNSITASYSGDINFNGTTSAPTFQAVNQGSTTTTLTVSSSSPTFGNSVTFTANVVAVAPASGTSNGSVTLKDGNTTLGTMALTNGVGTFITSALAGGSNNITAIFAGDTNFLTSSSSMVPVTVNTAASTTTLTVSPSLATIGAPVTLTATITPANGLISTDNETVSFYNNGVFLDSEQVSPTSGTATLPYHPGFTAAKNTLTAIYSGGTDLTTSTSSPVILYTESGPLAITNFYANPASLPIGSPTTPTFTVSFSGGVGPTTGIIYQITSQGNTAVTGSFTNPSPSTLVQSQVSIPDPSTPGMATFTDYQLTITDSDNNQFNSGVTGATVIPGTFNESSDSLLSSRTRHSATLLADGRVLLAGGVDANGNALNTVEIHDPTQTRQTQYLTLTTARSGHTGTLLANGMVMVSGGVDASGQLVDTAEILDPTQAANTAPLSQSSSLILNLASARTGHTANLLWDGTVLVAGGVGITPPGTSLTSLNTAEILDPALATPSGTHTPAAPLTMTAYRSGHTATLLPDGTVLLAGGVDNSTPTAQAQATGEIYNSATGAFTAIAGSTMSTPRTGAAAVLLPGATPQVLFLGGSNASGSLQTVDSYSAGAFAPFGASLVFARNQPTATYLYDSRVLVVGGTYTNGAPIETAASGEVYDPGMNAFLTLASQLNVPRAGHTATLTTNNTVFIAGGIAAYNQSTATPGTLIEMFLPQDGAGYPVPPQATIAGFAGPASVYPGTQFNLNWTGGVNASQLILGSVDTEGNSTSTILTPGASSFTVPGIVNNTTYTLTGSCTSAAPPVYLQTTVQVTSNDAPSIGGFTGPITAAPNTAFPLYWTGVTNATSLTLTGVDSSSKTLTNITVQNPAPNGSIQITGGVPYSTNMTYTLTVSNTAAGQSTALVTVQISSSQGNNGPAITTFASSISQVAANTAFTLNWTGVTNYTANTGIVLTGTDGTGLNVTSLTNPAGNGSYTVTNGVSATTYYTLTASNGSVQATAQVTVIVSSGQGSTQPVIGSFNGPGSVAQSASFALAWGGVTNYTPNNTPNNGIWLTGTDGTNLNVNSLTSPNGNGFYTVTNGVSANTTYTLTAYNPPNQATSTWTVDVQTGGGTGLAAGPVITVTPTSVQSGSQPYPLPTSSTQTYGLSASAPAGSTYSANAMFTWTVSTGTCLLTPTSGIGQSISFVPTTAGPLFLLCTVTDGGTTSSSPISFRVTGGSGTGPGLGQNSINLVLPPVITAGSSVTVNAYPSQTGSYTYVWLVTSATLSGTNAVLFVNPNPNNGFISFTAPASGNLNIICVANNPDGSQFATATATAPVGQLVGALSDLAGVPTGLGDVDGTGPAARFAYPAGIAVNANTNVIYVADTQNNTIRMLTSGGQVTTFAGTPMVSGSTDSGSGGPPSFFKPFGLAVDSVSGNVYVADTYNSTIRMITSTGVVSTLAGTAGATGSIDSAYGAPSFDQPQAVAVDPNTHNVYVADTNNSTIRMITSGGVVTTLAGMPGNPGYADGQGNAAQFDYPEGVAFDSTTGNIYVADTSNNFIRKIAPGGMVTTLPVGSYASPVDLTVDGSGNLYVADAGDGVVDMITNPATNPVVYTYAGAANQPGNADGPGQGASFYYPMALGVDASGNVYVADTGNSTIRLVTPPTGSVSAWVSTLAGTPPNPGSAAGFSTTARFNGPGGLAADVLGNVYVADTGNSVIDLIPPSGMVIPLAGMAGSPGNNDGAVGTATFTNPQGVAVDGSGNVYVADTGDSTIRMIQNGQVSTLAGTAGSPGSGNGAALGGAGFNAPQSVAVDGLGNVYVADTGNNTIRMLQNGQVSTLAGTAGTTGHTDSADGAPSFNAPSAVAVDSNGNLYVADTGNGTIREIAPPNGKTPTWTVTTLAGTAGQFGSADGTGPAASFNTPTALTVDMSGNVYVTDQGNSTVRLISPTGVVTTVLGAPGFVGTIPGPVPALLYNPTGIAVNPQTGTLFVSVPDAVLEQSAQAFPAAPIITAPAYVTANTNYTASTPAQNGFILTWTITNGSIIEGATDGTSIIFTAGASGSVQLACVASAAQTGAVGAGGPPTTYQGTATSTVIAPPSIISFTTGTDPTSGKTVLIPTFTSDSNAFATAFINPGNLGATSGQETPIVQSGDTAYTLTVINSAGSLVTSQPLTVKGTVTPNTGGSGVHRKLKGGKEQKTAPPLPF